MPVPGATMLDEKTDNMRSISVLFTIEKRFNFKFLRVFAKWACDGNNLRLFLMAVEKVKTTTFPSQNVKRLNSSQLFPKSGVYSELVTPPVSLEPGGIFTPSELTIYKNKLEFLDEIDR
ncbi:hypothetical protein LOAG_02914 [Loa loa]|uniref:Uncharacterized protein n=1 Tax=Loa loa TaxID=7209 RepID=A0A1S0U637_LOALO|nr:hypothetical protein LOAG_02914 [Loa loa]EFO25576.1 hypothetical protein LOAG_02914 [Loa loa]